MHNWKKKRLTKWINKISEFRRKLRFTEYDIMVLEEYSIELKIWKMFANENIFEEYCVKIYQIDPYFIKIMGKNKSW